MRREAWASNGVQAGLRSGGAASRLSGPGARAPGQLAIDPSANWPSWQRPVICGAQLDPLPVPRRRRSRLGIGQLAAALLANCASAATTPCASRLASVVIVLPRLVQRGVVAKSFYKGERLGSRPPCLLCMGRGEGERAELHLPYGVTVWLCAAHRSVEFQVRRAGRDFVASLSRAWAGAGCLTRARERALDAHRARVLPARPARERPGSYSWPALRGEAERRFAAGEAPARVIRELRERERAGRALPPSARTMRRWFGEGRWLGSDGASGRGGPNRPPGGDAEGHDPARPAVGDGDLGEARRGDGHQAGAGEARHGRAGGADRPAVGDHQGPLGPGRRQRADGRGDPGARVRETPRPPVARPTPRASRREPRAPRPRPLRPGDRPSARWRPRASAGRAGRRPGRAPRPSGAPGAGRRSRRRPA